MSIPLLRSADVWRMVGVNTKFATWLDNSGFQAELQYAQITRIRDTIAYSTNTPASYPGMQAMAQLGIKILLTAGNVPTTTAEFYVRQAREQLGPDAVIGFEGVNEYDGAPGVSAANTIAFQTALKAQKSADQWMGGVPLYAPTFIYNGSPIAQAGGISDVGNAHTYCNWHKPEGSLENSLAATQVVNGSLAVAATEFGYRSGYPDTIGIVPDAMPNSVIAAYVVRAVLYYALKGMHSLYFYDIMDDGADHTVWDNNWGLWNSDHTRKPQATALIRLLNALKDTGYVTNDPQLLGFNASMSGTTQNVQFFALSRSDGTTLLAIWNASEIWDGNNHVAVVVPDQMVTLSLPTLYPNLSVMQPSLSSKWTAAAQNSDNSLTLAVQPHATLIWLR